jgi:hypothetical protein
MKTSSPAEWADSSVMQPLLYSVTITCTFYFEDAFRFLNELTSWSISYKTQTIHFRNRSIATFILCHEDLFVKNFRICQLELKLSPKNPKNIHSLASNLYAVMTINFNAKANILLYIMVWVFCCRWSVETIFSVWKH